MREWGTRVIVEKVDAPAMQITTRSGGYNSEGQLYLGEQCFLLSFGQRHWHLVRWSGDRVEFSYESKAAKDTFHSAAFQDVMRRTPLSVARTASASAPSSYDPRRFVAIVAHGGLGFFLDCYGQVAVRETTGRMLGMFMAFRDRIAAWLPDGSRCGTAALGLGPETPGARAKLAAALRRDQARPRRLRVLEHADPPFILVCLASKDYRGYIPYQITRRVSRGGFFMEATIENAGMLQHLGVDSNVREFCRIHGLLAALANAIQLARDCFSPHPCISLSLSPDPDGGPDRLVIDVKVRCSVDDAVAAYDGFLPRWIASAARGDREKIVVVYSVA